MSGRELPDVRADLERRMAEAATREPHDRILDGFVRLFYEARQQSQTLKQRYGVTAAQLTLLKVLEKLGDQTHSDLSEKCYLRGSTVTGIIDRLEKAGLVKRRRSKTDRRLVKVVLADAGRKLLGSVPRGQSKFGALRRFLAALPKDEADRFSATLDKIVTFMSQKSSEPRSETATAHEQEGSAR